MPRAPIKQLPSGEELWKLFHYHPFIGELVWKWRDDANFNARYAYQPAGTRFSGRNGNKYIAVGMGKGNYVKAHRIIWKIMTDEEPPSFIDHINGDNFDNRWANLRDATNSQNIQNSKLRRDNKSGVKGVSWDKGHGKWLASISIGGRQIKIGRFDNLDDAAAAITAARKELHGKYARYG